ncbi:type II toxin-antitoxin system HicA family toxin [Kitasatospora sp. NPDC001664]
MALERGDFTLGRSNLQNHWKLSAYDSGEPDATELWCAWFSPQTPYELTHGLVLDAAGRLGSDPATVLADRRAGDDIERILSDAGWTIKRGPWRTFIHSPGAATLLVPSHPERTLAFGMGNTSSELAWEVIASPWAPEAFLRTTAVTLASHSALRRRSEIPAHHLARVTIEPAASATLPRWRPLLAAPALPTDLENPLPTTPAPTAVEPPRGTGPEPDLVTVTPRHYAGPGRGGAEQIKAHLASLGWTLGNTSMTSPCGRLGLAWPDGTDDRTRQSAAWRVWGSQYRGASVAWRITSGDLVPPELIAGVVDEALAMLDEAGSDSRSPFQAGVLGLGFLPLAEAGWKSEVEPRGAVSFRSPDGYVSVHCDVPTALHDLRGKPAARISCYRALGYWMAEISANTPSRLAAALCRDLASPEPLLRSTTGLHLDATDRKVAIVTPVTPEGRATPTERRAAALSGSVPTSAAPSPPATTTAPTPLRKPVR